MLSIRRLALSPFLGARNFLLLCRLSNYGFSDQNNPMLTSIWVFTPYLGFRNTYPVIANTFAVKRVILSGIGVEDKHF